MLTRPVESVICVLLICVLMVGCATTVSVELYKQQPPTTTNKLTSKFDFDKDYYITFDYDVSKQEIKEIHEVKITAPTESEMLAMYNNNMQHYREGSGIVNECILFNRTGAYAPCIENHKLSAEDLSLYHDTDYGVTYTLGMVFPFPLLIPTMAMISPNNFARFISKERINYFGGIVDKNTMAAIKNNTQPLTGQMVAIVKTVDEERRVAAEKDAAYAKAYVSAMTTLANWAGSAVKSMITAAASSSGSAYVPTNGGNSGSATSSVTQTSGKVYICDFFCDTDESVAFKSRASFGRIEAEINAKDRDEAVSLVYSGGHGDNACKKMGAPKIYALPYCREKF